MKRYRVITADFDSRVNIFNPIQAHWEDHVKELHRKNQERAITQLMAEYGEINFDLKLENFKAIGAKPFSVVAYHNRFLDQSRQAFVFGQYYPALTSACALGERILNHLIIGLRDSYKSHSLYKKIYKHKSFQDWSLVINTLTDWHVLTPSTTESFRRLHKKRNDALHFNISTELEVKQHAKEAIKNLEEIINQQFSSFGSLPWLLPAPGECFIKKEFEASPFVQLVYLSNCARLGYKHVTTSVFPWEFQDADDYPDIEVSDDEFLRLRQEFQTS